VHTSRRELCRVPFVAHVQRELRSISTLLSVDRLVALLRKPQVVRRAAASSLTIIVCYCWRRYVVCRHRSARRSKTCRGALCSRFVSRCVCPQQATCNMQAVAAAPSLPTMTRRLANRPPYPVRPESSSGKGVLISRGMRLQNACCHMNHAGLTDAVV
jgi:hypothetical protein